MTETQSAGGKRLDLTVLVILILLMASVASCVPSSRPVLPPTPTPLPTAVVPEKPTYTVQRGVVEDILTFTGRVSPVKEAEIYFRTDGRVLTVHVAKGDSVRTGDLLAELDVSALRRELAQAEQAYESAQTDLASAESERTYQLARARIGLSLEQIALKKLEGYDPRLDVAVARAQLDDATVTLQRAQAAYDAVAHLPGIGARPESMALQQATLAYSIVNAAYDQAVQQSTQHAYNIQAQKKRVELAQLEVDHLASGADPRLEQAVTRAALDLDDVRAQITDTLIVAPLDGQVTAVTLSPGQAVEGFKPVIVVADPTQLEVTAELTADEMRDLSEGQAATVVPLQFPAQEWPASIRSLPYPYGSGGSAVGLEAADRATHLEVDFGSAVAPGELVRVSVVLQRKEGVLWLPPAAIRTFEGRKFVVVQEDAGQRRVDVAVGIESADGVEIVDGLKEGDVVVGP